MKVTVLIHGPWANNNIDVILRNIQAYCDCGTCKEVIDVLVVGYTGDESFIRSSVDGIGEMTIPINYVFVKDLFNPGFCNINRQIVSVSTGLVNISDDRFVVKLRNDQVVNFSKLFALLRRRRFLVESGKMLSTNCYTRKDRLYHPSDMFICGWKKQLLDYYSAPIMRETAAEWKLKMRQIIRDTPNEFQKKFLCPENYLFIHYLKKVNWELKYTVEDSYNAIKKYFIIVNSWNIELKWTKQRVPGRKAGSLILPMYGTWAPFSWDTPIVCDDGSRFYEAVKCYNRHDFEGKITKQDEHYINIAYKLYGWAKLPEKKYYDFPFDRIKKNDRVALYGAGVIGEAIYYTLIGTDYAELVLWSDSKYNEKPLKNKMVSPTHIMNYQFDWLLIAVESKSVALAIKQYLLELGVPDNKIIWSSGF